MTGTQSLELRGVIAAGMATASLVSWKLVPRLRMAAATFERLFLGAFALSRFGLFTLAMVILHLPVRGDVLLYLEEATPAFAGKLVYRDFATPHAPLDPYLLSSMLHLHNSPLTFYVFAIVFDLGAMWLWMKAAAFFLDTITLRRAALLVLFNPTSLLTEAIDGQMNSFVALFLGLGVYLLIRQRHFLSGAAVAVPAAVIKFLTLIFAPGFLFAVATTRKQIVATLGFIAVILAVYVPFGLAGADLRVPLSAEGPHKTASNFIYLIEFLTGHDLGLRLPDALLGLSWLAVVVVTFFCLRAVNRMQPVGKENATTPDRRRVYLILTLSLIAELLCIQIFSKNSWDRYLVMAMFPLCTLAASFTLLEICAFVVYAFAVCVEPSFWAGLLLLPTSLAARAALGSDPRFYALLFLEFLVVGGNVFLIVTALRKMLSLRRPHAVLTSD